MTNATVAAVAESNAGHALDLVFKNGSKKVAVPKGVPVVTILGGTVADVLAGLPVFIVATQKESGEMAALRIVVGNDGVASPM